MGEFILKMPDVGEGVAEAELVEWHVKPGDPVREDMVLAAVMTDKATVEIPSPVSGKVLWLGAEVGDTVAVKAPLVRIETAAATGEPPPDSIPEALAEEVLEEPVAVSAPPAPKAPPKPERIETGPAPTGAPPARDMSKKPLASPAVRLRAKDSGIDLRQVTGTGPAGRITHDDLDLFLSRGAQPAPAITGLVRKTAVEEIKVTGLRRRIAEKMTLSTSRIPHITYVEEMDMTALEDLRAMMNRDRKPDQPKLTVLPFLMRALVKTIAEQPGVNATFDDGAGIIHRHAAVHIGIATQTPAGLTVPVVRHAEARGIWDCAAELNRLADAARTGTATRDELTGSTITISSLGALGGIASTPVINHPEVAIVGVNKIAIRPVWDGTQFVPRKIMNLSSSFDHRVIDGWDAATFVQRLKTLLETPALIFVEG
ncbi:dihydrolipoamide acetyltransferase family protein [Sinorhizobium mexicanum]|uniref:Dihydrolipoamide acetyltransferase component of pyruvate dehydrogenase complex n=1 Tax=Sinorhizobium mexicanum TaxID=375549 RepID=A0A859R0Y2_9HYPH|nr:dihydrolipoamide acetyltransferase family protein [Sinorhizobium mexicanum]MBP1887542.1 2-oxoisovalerate dehydrogenase E2 component (dihydrolipoyl transacylase) [Sinorhizobium mexicanum]QLL63288.1 2-oxo acid dehydrogenase subunit E2 [Sinorhizobium mexicanum]